MDAKEWDGLEKQAQGWLSRLAQEGAAIAGVCLDSRAARSGDLFLALRGAKCDGRLKAAEAVQNGAVAVLWEPGGLPGEREPCARKLGVPTFAVENLQTLAGFLAQKAAGDPFGFGAAGGADAKDRGEGEPLAVVDYAHTPDALENALAALRPAAMARGGKLWAVFGCGGDRDPGKRPLMGAAAAALADCVVVTSDNPRSEDPGRIIEAVMEDARRASAGGAGDGRVWGIEDRAEAIAFAIARAGDGDVVLLAGKGHEAYQEAAGARLPFSDCAQARAALY